MIFEWLNKSTDATNNQSLIVFFSGWGVSSELITHLDCEGCDVLYIEDYRELSDIPSIDHYQQRVLVAWSFGVASFIAWQKQQANNTKVFDKLIAINGSYAPVDRRLGIPPKVMQLTIDTLTPNSLKKFHRRCGIADPIKGIESKDISALKQELETIRDRHHPTPNIHEWHKVIVSKSDKIIPSENTERAWLLSSCDSIHTTTETSKPTIATIIAPHSPFHKWSSWSEIIN